MAQLSKTDRGDEGDGVKLSELFYGRHFRGIDITTVVFLYSDEICHLLCCSGLSFVVSDFLIYGLIQAMSKGMQAVARSSLVSGSPVVWIALDMHNFYELFF